MADDGKASYSNVTMEAEVKLFQRKGDDDFIKNISNSDDYDVYIVQAFAKGRNYNGHEWTRFYSIKVLGFATKNFEESLKVGDLIRVRGELDINDWYPKDADNDAEPNESEVIVIDPRKGGYWAHSTRWDAAVSLREEQDHDTKSSSRGGRSRAKDDDDEDDAPRRGRSSRSSRDKEEDEDDSPRNRRSSRSKDDDEDDAPRSRARGRAKDDDEDDDEPRGRARGRSRDKEDDADEEPSPRGRARRGRRGDDDND